MVMRNQEQPFSIWSMHIQNIDGVETLESVETSWITVSRRILFMNYLEMLLS